MSWFSNFIAYRITSQVDLSVETLQAALAQKPSRELGDEELKHLGFRAPLPSLDGEASQVLAHQCGDSILLCAESHTRSIPGDAVKREVEIKVQAIEKESQRKVRGAERKEITEGIRLSLAKRVLAKRKRTPLLVIPSSGLIIVNTNKAADAEDILSLIRQVLGSLPVRPLSTVHSPSAVMTGWLREKETPQDLTHQGSALFMGSESGKAKLDDIDLFGEEVNLHLAAGMTVSNIELLWQDKIGFRLNSKLVFEKIKFKDMLRDQAADAAGEGDVLQNMDATITIMSASLQQMLSEVCAAFGGENKPEGI